MNDDIRDLNPDIHALCGAYAVDALDDLERVRFEAHLAECSACREEVASLTETAGLLGAGAETMPPAGLRDRVLADIGKVRPLPPVPVTDELSAKRDVVRRRRLPQLVAAAAAILAVGVGVTVTQPWNDDSSQTVSVADQVLNARDAVGAIQQVDGATAMLVRSESVGRAVLKAENMPALPGSKVYELWFQNAAGKVTSAGLMSGSGDQTFLLDGDASSAVWAGITVEPAGGSDTPSMPTIAAFDFNDMVAL